MTFRILAKSAGLSIALILSGATLASGNPGVEIKSGAVTVPVLELYTSEGCSSCPPAEKFLQQLMRESSAHHQVIPLAFHVDYWNYLGWQDPFSNAEYSRRQQRLARINHLRSVYTPQFVLHGSNFPAYRNLESAIKLINDDKPKANLQFRVSQRNANKLETRTRVELSNRNNPANASLFLAVYENNLTRSIKAGENSGRTLRHEYVVRKLYGPHTLVSDGPSEINQDIDLDPEWKRQDLGIAVFVQNRQDGSTLQALDLPLDRLMQDYPAR